MPKMQADSQKQDRKVFGTDDEFEILIGREYSKRACELIKNAKEEVLLSVFMWYFYYGDPGCEASKLNQEMINAVKRGVKVRGLCSSTAKLRKMIECGCDIKESTFANKLHNKIMIIDKKWVLLGSHNITKNAMERNYEVSSLFEIEGPQNRLYKFVNTMVAYNG